MIVDSLRSRAGRGLGCRCCRHTPHWRVVGGLLSSKTESRNAENANGWESGLDAGDGGVIVWADTCAGDTGEGETRGGDRRVSVTRAYFWVGVPSAWNRDAGSGVGGSDLRWRNVD